ncbi:hypothetical protein R5R35_010818 [Gryllus longicercus]|uniref:Uncharacterized protein n=1 Tax=Gryllus longicercus TaxID=2509291 RepID=A0AAN9W0N3_9ORTH
MELVTYSVYAEELKLQNETGNPNSSYRSLLIVGATVSALLLLSNVLLLLGVHKNRASLLLPWLLVYSVLTCLSLIVIWLTVYAVFKNMEFLDAVGMLSLSLFKAALVLYCILVVHSFYCSLKETAAVGPQAPPYLHAPAYSLPH